MKTAKTLFRIGLGAIIVLGSAVSRAQDALPSWNDGPAKQSIIDFVGKMTKQDGSEFVRPAERIATFDNDGTMLVHHDDAQREFAYGAESRIGSFSDTLMAKAKKNAWTVISMKDDWKRIFAFEQ